MAIAEAARKFWFETQGNDPCAMCGHERKYHRGVGSAGFCQKCLPPPPYRPHNFFIIGGNGAVEWCEGDYEPPYPTGDKV